MSTLKFCAKHSRRKGYAVLAHTHSAYEMVYYVSGDVKSLVDGQSYNFSPAMLSIIPPGVLHGEYCLTDITTMWCIFDPGLAKLSTKLSYSADELKDTALPQLLGNMFSLLDNKSADGDNEMQSLFDAIFAELLRLSPQEKAAPYPNKTLEYACQFLKDNFSRQIDLADLANQVGYSYDRFRHLFKSSIGCSPYSYLMKLRVDNAKKLCRQTALQMSDIASLCGFSSISSFIRAFRLETGVTPMQYRKQTLAV